MIAEPQTEKSEGVARRPERRRRKAVLAAVPVVAAAVLQLIPAPPRTNPAVTPGRRIQDNLNMPKEISALLDRACANCHSNETRWPWYSRIAPASWLVRNDVDRARHAMNFSEWRDGSRSWRVMGVAKLAAACAALQAGAMPPASYRLLHPEARLSDADKRGFCDWTRDEIEGGAKP
jgi:hypothetical protein